MHLRALKNIKLLLHVCRSVISRSPSRYRHCRLNSLQGQWWWHLFLLKHANPVILVHGSHIPAKKLCEKAECLHCALDHNLWLSELQPTSVFTMAFSGSGRC